MRDNPEQPRPIFQTLPNPEEPIYFINKEVEVYLESRYIKINPNIWLRKSDGQPVFRNMPFSDFQEQSLLTTPGRDINNNNDIPFLKKQRIGADDIEFEQNVAVQTLQTTSTTEALVSDFDEFGFAKTSEDGASDENAE